jgi:hypothetical protein
MAGTPFPGMLILPGADSPTPIKYPFLIANKISICYKNCGEKTNDRENHFPL